MVSRAKRWGAGAAILAVGAALGCDARAWNLRQYEREIERSTSALAAARSDAERARAHAARAHGYSEKARYSRAFKLVTPAEYLRLFEAALEDHERAIALAPADAALYLGRGQTCFDRAGLEDAAEVKATWLAAAEADLTHALEREPRNAQALDLRGIVRSQRGEQELAIADFTEELKLDPRLGKLRLADEWCRRGSRLQIARQTDEAILAFEKAVALEADADACECQPAAPLALLYLDRKQYDRSWDVVHRAQAAHHPVDPEVVQRLEQESGRGR